MRIRWVAKRGVASFMVKGGTIDLFALLGRLKEAGNSDAYWSENFPNAIFIPFSFRGQRVIFSLFASGKINFGAGAGIPDFEIVKFLNSLRPHIQKSVLT